MLRGRPTLASIYLSIYLCVYVCMYVCMHACMHACMYVCMYVSIYLSIYLSMYLCIYPQVARAHTLWCPLRRSLTRRGWTFPSGRSRRGDAAREAYVGSNTKHNIFLAYIGSNTKHKLVLAWLEVTRCRVREKPAARSGALDGILIRGNVFFFQNLATKIKE